MSFLPTLLLAAAATLAAAPPAAAPPAAAPPEAAKLPVEEVDLDALVRSRDAAPTLGTTGNEPATTAQPAPARESGVEGTATAAPADPDPAGKPAASTAAAEPASPTPAAQDDAVFRAAAEDEAEPEAAAAAAPGPTDTARETAVTEAAAAEEAEPSTPVPEAGSEGAPTGTSTLPAAQDEVPAGADAPRPAATDAGAAGPGGEPAPRAEDWQIPGRSGRTPSDLDDSRAIDRAHLEACLQHAQALLDAAGNGDWDKATSAFSGELQAALPADEFARAWQSLARFGKLEARGQPHPGMGQGYYIVSVPLIFEQANLYMQIACNADERIVGFHVKPLEPGAN